MANGQFLYPGRQLGRNGGTFVWANGEISGNKVTVSHPDITNPTIVRYAWADSPQGANLYPADGLPASPFEIRKDK